MDVTVTMAAEDFLEFMAWKKDRTYYAAELDGKNRKMETLAKKVCWAIGEDQKRPGKAKIIDQEHAAELLEMANDFLA